MSGQSHTAEAVLREIIPAVQAYLMTGDSLAQAAKRRVWGPVLKRAASASGALGPSHAALLEAIIELRDAAQHDEAEQFVAALDKADAAIDLARSIGGTGQ